MKTENKLKELKAAREAALGAYIAATDITVAAHDNYHANSDCWEAYRSACDNSKALFEVYTAADKAYEEARWTNKMKTENKMKELKAAAWDAHIAHVDADTIHGAARRAYLAATDAYDTHNSALIRRCGAGDAYVAARCAYNAAWDAYNAAGEAAQQVADIANAYEVGEYETNPYEAEAYVAAWNAYVSACEAARDEAKDK